MARLRLEGLEKTYIGRFGHVKVWPLPAFTFGPVDLVVENGECLALLGAADSGKTTLRKLIAGQISADTGDIWLDDVSLTNMATMERDVSVVFGQPLLVEQMSIEENVAMGLKLRGVHGRKRSRLAREMLHTVGVIGPVLQTPSDLSTAQQLRVSLARALVLRPQLLLMDDPFTGLEGQRRQEIQRLFTRIQRKLRCTTLFLTREASEACEVATRIGIVEDGLITRIGSPDEFRVSSRR